MRKDIVSIIAAVLILGLSGYALLHLLLMRYTAGDVYPKYSSLRTDPFGTKAIYESLEDCCDLKISRNFEEFYKIKDSTNSAIVFAGAGVPEDKIPATFLMDLESFMKNGGRLIVTYEPSGFFEEAMLEAEEKQQKAKKDSEKKEPEKDSEDNENDLIQLISLSKRWGLEYEDSDWSGFRNARLVAEEKLPKILTWHSPIYFDLTGQDWRVLYEQGGRTVLAERKFGKGSLVLASDSFFLSNEAMLRDRHPDLLAWLISSKKEVIFDEFHHGVTSNPGVAALARKYNLHGLAAGTLVIAVLFVWMSSTSLVPAYKSGSELEKKAVAGKDSPSGLANLLRRSVPAQSIFSFCCSEWKKSSLRQKHIEEKKMKRVEEFIKQELAGSDRVKNPAASYNRISEILKER